MANPGESAASPLPDESTCDGDSIQDGRKSVRDIKFMFDKGASSGNQLNNSVVFASMREKTRESSTDTLLHTKIRKLKDIFEASKNIDSTGHPPSETANDPVNTSAATKGAAEIEEERGDANLSPVKDINDMRASLVITSSFSFLQTLDSDETSENCEKEEAPEDVHQSADVQNDEESEGLGSKDSYNEEQSRGPETQSEKNLEAHKKAHKKASVESPRSGYDDTLTADKQNDMFNEGSTISISKMENAEIQAGDANVASTGVDKSEGHDEVKTPKSEASRVSQFITSSFSFLPHEEDDDDDDEEENEETENDDVQASETVKERSRDIRKSEVSRVSKMITSSFSFLPHEDEMSDGCEGEDDDSEQAEERDADQRVDATPEQAAKEDGSTEDTEAKVDTTIEDDRVHVLDTKESNKLHDDDGENLHASHEPTVSKSPSQSSTGSGPVLLRRSSGKKSALFRHPSRSGFVSEAGSNIERNLTRALRLSEHALEHAHAHEHARDAESRQGEGSVDVSIPRRSCSVDAASSGSGEAESPRLRTKVDRSSSSGSYDGSRTLEGLRLRSRSHSPGVSDGSDDDEDDDEGIYAETFRYSSYIFIGDTDTGEGMSFSASTPDFSALQRRLKARKASSDVTTLQQKREEEEEEQEEEEDDDDEDVNTPDASIAAPELLPVSGNDQAEDDQAEDATDALKSESGAGVKTDELGLKTDELGLKTDELGLKTDELGLKTDELGLKTDELGLKIDELGLAPDGSGARLTTIPSVVARSISVGSENESTSSEGFLSRDSTCSTFSDADNVENDVRAKAAEPQHFTKNHLHRRRSESTSTTLSERDFRARYHAQSTKHVQRSDSTISYKRHSNRFYEVERTFELVRQDGEKGFGFHVRGSCPVVVSNVEKGGSADRGGLLVGDVLLEVANVNVMSMSGGDLRSIIKPDTRSLLMSVAEDRRALEHLDSGHPILHGYLFKQGGVLKTWRKRWFALHKDNCLYYYKTAEDTDPLGAVLLTNYSVSKAHDVNRPHCFRLSKFGARSYVFQAQTDADRTLWAEKIHQATKLEQKGDTFLSKSSHNVSLQACSIKDPCCHGYLTKLGNRRKTWKRRYCVLKDACMYYYLDIQSSTAQGVAHFHGYTVVPGALGKRYGFTLEPPEPRMRTYYFVADGESCYARWVSAMEKSIARWVRVPDRPAR